MSKPVRKFIYLILTLAVLAVLAVGLYQRFSKPSIEQFDIIDRLPVIYPDYSGIVIPPNIAPLNFLVKEKGDYYFVRIHSQNGEPVEIFSRGPKVIIPRKAWRNLLSSNRGQQSYFDIFVRNGKNRWARFSRITNKIANEDIDNFVVYRKMNPTHALFSGPIGVYQRDLRNYDEKLILNKSYLGKEGCTNCHAFRCNKTDTCLLGIRGASYGISTLIIQNGKIDKIDAKFGFSSWHPSGKLVVYSVDDLPMFFHSTRSEIRDTVDMDSYLAYYLVDSRILKTSPELSGKEQLETWPAWSADGKYLYFCRASKLWSGRNKIPPVRYKDIKYDLVRISYDVNSDQWEQLETIVSGVNMDKSIVMPRASPDGRWLSCCIFDYGFFPAWQEDSDLFLIDLEAGKKTGQYTPRRLQSSADGSESWHSWSSNSRWIVFGSKREYGVFTKLYISYIGEDGTGSKALLLPQKDPLFYNSCLLSYNTPEFVNESIPYRCEELARVVRSPEKISVDLPVTMATPKAERTAEHH